MDWFKKHLSWTLGISNGLATALLIILIFVIEQANSELVTILISFLNLFIVACWWIVSTWVLVQKKRSLAWLLLLLVPMGWIVLLFLKNQAGQDSILK